jgi:hypothetical protein
MALAAADYPGSLSTRSVLSTLVSRYVLALQSSVPQEIPDSIRRAFY